MNPLKMLMYSPFTTHIVVTRRCNLSCGYCNEFDHSSSPVSVVQIKKEILKVYELGGFISLTFTGGEPLLHPKIAELIAFANIYIWRIGLITNGFLLTKEKILELNESGLYGLQISVDGIKPNDQTVKVLDNLKEKIILLKKYAKFRVNINAVAGASSFSETLNIVKYVRSLGIKVTVSLIHDENGEIKLNGNGGEKYEILQNYAEKNYWGTYFEEELIKNGENPFKCRAGCRFLYIDEFGDVHWCSQQREKFKKPFAEYSLKDLKEQFHTYKECSRKCTLGCGRDTSNNVDTARRQGDLTERMGVRIVNFVKDVFLFLKNFSHIGFRSQDPASA